MANPRKQAKWSPKVGDYVEIVGTDDEFEGLIGILDEFMPATEDNEEAWVLFIPTSRSDLRSRKMVGLNDLTQYVKYVLREGDNKIRITQSKFEQADPADF